MRHIESHFVISWPIQANINLPQDSLSWWSAYDELPLLHWLSPGLIEFKWMSQYSADLKHLVFACRVQGWQGEDLELFLTHDQDLEDMMPGT